MRMKVILSIFMLTAYILAGYGGGTKGEMESISLEQNIVDEEQMENFGLEEADIIPADYTVPEGWVKEETRSTPEKVFYVQEGHENDGQPDNISVNIGENPYGKDQHVQFKEAIFHQLVVQIGGLNAELYGEGTFTEQGDPLYIFTIEDKDDGVTTTQYYVVGDYRFGLIHLTNFTGSESADEAAQTMAESFVWKEEEMR